MAGTRTLGTSPMQVAGLPLATRRRPSSMSAPQTAAAGASFATALQRAQRTSSTGRTPLAAWPAARSAAVLRISQLDPREFDTAAQARQWGPSACSAAALAMVLRARGSTVKVGDIVKALGNGWSPQRGLLGRQHLVRAAATFGLRLADRAMSLEELGTLTSSGTPVLVDVVNGRFPAGHWLVVTGVDAQGVSVADSSGYRLTRMSRQEFLGAWNGRGLVAAGQ